MEDLIQLYPGDGLSPDDYWHKKFENECFGGAIKSLYAESLEGLNMWHWGGGPRYAYPHHRRLFLMKDYIDDLIDTFIHSRIPLLDAFSDPDGNMYTDCNDNCVLRTTSTSVTTYEIMAGEHPSIINGETCLCSQNNTRIRKIEIGAEEVIFTCRIAPCVYGNYGDPIKMVVVFNNTPKMQKFLSKQVQLMEEYQRVLLRRKKIAKIIDTLGLQPVDLREVPAGSILLARRGNRFFGPLRLGNTRTRVWDRGLDYVGLLGVKMQDGIFHSRCNIRFRGKPTNGYTWGDSIADVCSMEGEFFVLVPGEGKPWREYANPTRDAQEETMPHAANIDSKSNWQVIEDYLNGFNIERAEKLLGLGK